MKDKISQKYCPFCDTLGTLQHVSVVRDNWYGTGTPLSIRFQWDCQECHSRFDTEVPYLEILKVD